MRNERERLSGSDEVELIELMQRVWRQKLWIVLTVLLVGLFALAYVKLASPVYVAKLYIRSPSQNEIAQINIGRGANTGLAPLSVKDVYNLYLQSLQSEAVRDQFFHKAFLPTLTEEQRSGSREILYARFNAALTIMPVNGSLSDRYVITANLDDPQLAASWVSRYAELAEEQAKDELLRGARSDIAVMSGNLEQKIKSSRASAGNQRSDQIAQLKEALRVAKSIGLEKPPIISNTLSSEVSAGMGGSLTYMRGSKALEAEIANLEARPSDDPYIPGLRENQEKLNFLRNLKIDPALVSMYEQDGVVALPDMPVKPRKGFIMALALVAGVAMGVCVAIARDLWVRRRLSTDG